MAKVADRPNRVSNLLKHEYGFEHGYERGLKELTIPAGAQIGGVYKADGTIVSAADVADLEGPLAILIDDNVYMYGGNNTYVVLTGGPGASGAAVIVREQLSFGDELSEEQIDAVVALIEAQGIKVGQQV